jgi:hypothetical protein
MTVDARDPSPDAVLLRVECQQNQTAAGTHAHDVRSSVVA